MPLELLLVLLTVGCFVGICLIGLIGHALGCIFNK